MVRPAAPTFLAPAVLPQRADQAPAAQPGPRSPARLPFLEGSPPLRVYSDHASALCGSRITLDLDHRVLSHIPQHGEAAAVLRAMVHAFQFGPFHSFDVLRNALYFQFAHSGQGRQRRYTCVCALDHDLKRIEGVSVDEHRSAETDGGAQPLHFALNFTALGAPARRRPRSLSFTEAHGDRHRTPAAAGPSGVGPAPAMPVVRAARAAAASPPGSPLTDADAPWSTDSEADAPWSTDSEADAPWSTDSEADAPWSTDASGGAESEGDAAGPSRRRRRSWPAHLPPMNTDVPLLYTLAGNKQYHTQDEPSHKVAEALFAGLNGSGVERFVDAFAGTGYFTLWAAVQRRSGLLAPGLQQVMNEWDGYRHNTLESVQQHPEQVKQALQWHLQRIAGLFYRTLNELPVPEPVNGETLEADDRILAADLARHIGLDPGALSDAARTGLLKWTVER